MNRKIPCTFFRFSVFLLLFLFLSIFHLLFFWFLSFICLSLFLSFPFHLYSSLSMFCSAFTRAGYRLVLCYKLWSLYIKRCCCSLHLRVSHCCHVASIAVIVMGFMVPRSSFDQESSPPRPHYALSNMVVTTAFNLPCKMVRTHQGVSLKNMFIFIFPPYELHVQSITAIR
jgi:hypothetical protein